MPTLENQNAFMDKFIELTGASEAYAAGIWHSLSENSKHYPVQAATEKAYPALYGQREADFKAELKELCKKHNVFLSSGFNAATDTAIYGRFVAPTDGNNVVFTVDVDFDF